jgi:hypothetical protein
MENKFKVHDRVQTIRSEYKLPRRSVGNVRGIDGEFAFVQFDNGRAGNIELSNLRPHTKRIRPTKATEKHLRQEIAIRNDAIDRLENSVEILQSEKIRLGETNAWLTEQNDALRKEVLAANEAMEHERGFAMSVVDVKNNTIEIMGNQMIRMESEQAKTSLRLYIYQTIAVIAVIGCAVLGAILWVG